MAIEQEAIFGIIIGICMAIVVVPNILTAIFELTKTTKDMYYVQKKMEISAAHSLRLDYESKCQHLHGHNWHVCVFCKSKTLNVNGMVEDFTLIKKSIQDKLDHMYLNEVLPFNPTAENMAKWMCDQIPTAYKVSVQESDGNTAIYVKEDSDEDK